MELKSLRIKEILLSRVPPFFSYKSYDPHHQSFPVGWGVYLNLFYTGKFCIHPFFLEDCEEKIGRCDHC